MESPVEEIWRILREVAISQQEVKAIFKETDAKFKETDAQFKETRAQIKETDAMLSAKFKQTDAQFKETDRKLKAIGKNLGNIGERFGSFTEGLAYPSMRKILRERYGIDNTVANYLRDLPDGKEIEFDAFGFTNGTVNNAVVVEVMRNAARTHLQSKHIYEFKKELLDFKSNFPEFKDKHLHGILVTARRVSKELKNEIFENGLHLAIVNNDVFNFKQNPLAMDFNLNT